MSNLAKTNKNSKSSNKRIMKSNTTTNVVSNFFNDEKKPSEAKVLVYIKDIKYGDKQILNPEVTTIYEGKKLSYSVPFNTPIEYSFEKVEDEMIFKFAVNGTGDLLGFLYLEIPHRFKAIQQFSLDDWFPIKQIETEDEIALQMQNFVVRVVLNYTAVKKLKVDDKFENNIELKKGYQNLAKNLKNKIKTIHQEIDNFEGEGMVHLREFEKKMLNKKVKMRKWEKSPSPFPDQKEHKNHLNQQKHKFYKNTQIIGKSPQVKNHKITPTELYPFEEGKFKMTGQGKEINEKLFKELCLTRKDLIDAKQKLSEFEDGLITIDNQKFKELLEKQKKELFTEKENLHLKINQQNILFEEEKKKLKEDYLQEKLKLDELKKDTKSVINNYENKLVALEAEKNELKNMRYEMKVQENQIKKQFDELEEKRKEVIKYEAQINDKNNDIDEVKKRIMIERNFILKETQDYEYLKGDVIMQKQILKNERELLEDRLKHFEEDCRKRVKDLFLSEEKLEGLKKIFSLEKENFNDGMKNLEKKMAEVNEDKKALKVEGVRLWKEKNQNQEEIKEFMEWKKIVDNEYKEQQKELESDYDYIDKQLQLIEKNKLEFDNLKGHLEQYETYLENQQRIQNEQIQRFYIIQKQFFLKLRNDHVEIEELRTYADKFDVDYVELERKRADTAKLTDEIEFQKDNFKKTINNITLDVRDITLKDRKKSNIIRKQSRMSRMSVFGDLQGFEREFRVKIKNDANKIIENMFIDICVKKLGVLDQEKDKYIKKLETTIEYINDNTLVDHKDIKHHDTNFDILKKIEVKRKSFSEVKDRSPSFGRLNLKFNNQAQFLEEVKNLEVYKLAIDKICDNAIGVLEEGINDSETPDDRTVIQERITSLEKCKTVLSSIVRFLTKFHLNKEFDGDVLASLNLLNKDINIEEIRKKYEGKIRLLVDYIKKVKTNSNFFNYNVDNDILVNK